MLDEQELHGYKKWKDSLVQEALVDGSLLAVCGRRTQPLRRAGQLLKEKTVGAARDRIPTGFPELDKLLGGGVSARQVTQVVGSAKSGKSTFVHYLLKHFLETNKTRALYVSPVNDAKVLHRRLDSNALFSRVRVEQPTDEKFLLMLLAHVETQLADKLAHRTRTSDPLFALTDARQSRHPDADTLLAAKPDRDEFGLIIIEEVAYFLFAKTEGYEHLFSFTRAIGACLRKISATFGVPILVTASLDKKDDPETKYVYPPWHNFIGESICIQKLLFKDQPGEDRRTVLRKLVAEKNATFFLNSVEGVPQTTTMHFKVKVAKLSDCKSSNPRQQLVIEKTVVQPRP